MNRFLAAGRLFALCAVVAWGANPGVAAMLGETSPTNVSPAPSDGFTVGYEFKTGADPLFVTALGVWDEGNPLSPGLSESHEIAIWHTDGTQLIGAHEIIGPSGSDPSGTQIGAWLFVTLAAPVPLLVNTDYVIGVFDGTGTDKYHGSTTTSADFPVSNSPTITFVERRADAGPGPFTFPNSLAQPGASAWDMPNFKFVPEPASMGLLMMGGLLLLRRRRAA